MDEITYHLLDEETGRSNNPKNFSVESINFIRERDEYRCRCCGKTGGVQFETIPHHIFWKSQIDKTIANLPENGAYICRNCHRIIHTPANEAELVYQQRYDKKLKLQALAELKPVISEEAFATLRELCAGLGYYGKALNFPSIHGILFV